MLIAKEGGLSRQDLSSQLQHMKNMALGNNTVPFRYGHFVDSTHYDPEQRLIHGDGFGAYYHSKEKSTTKRYDRAVFSVSDEESTRDVPEDPYVSMMHARLVTEGNKDPSNIQPIELESIVGMHNGTIRGLGDGKESDSNYIMRRIDSYFSSKSSKPSCITAKGLEKVFVDEIVKECSSYSSMNLIFYSKNTDKVYVLCSYDESKVISREQAQYYTMTIIKDCDRILVSSESDCGKVMRNSKRITTKNHTLYIIDKKTGEIEEYDMGKLEKAIEKKSKEEEGKEKKAEGGDREEGDREEKTEGNNSEENNQECSGENSEGQG